MGASIQTVRRNRGGRGATAIDELYVIGLAGSVLVEQLHPKANPPLPSQKANARESGLGR